MSPPVIFHPAYEPTNVFSDALTTSSPASYPIYTLSAPLVVETPAWNPMEIPLDSEIVL